MTVLAQINETRIVICRANGVKDAATGKTHCSENGLGNVRRSKRSRYRLIAELDLSYKNV